MQLVTSFSGDRAVTHIAEQRTQSHIQYSLAERPQLTQSLTLSFATPVLATQPPSAFDVLKADKTLTETCSLRQHKYFNNIVEQEHRPIKRLVNPGLGFKSFHTAWQTIRGYETMNMIRKGQLQGIERDIKGQVKFIAQIFGVVA